MPESIQRQQVQALIGEGKAILAEGFNIASSSLEDAKDYVRRRFDDVCEYLQKAQELGMVNLQEIYDQGNWFEDISIKVRRNGDRGVIAQISKKDRPDTRSGTGHKKQPDNYKTIFETAVKHVMRNCEMHLQGKNEPYYRKDPDWRPRPLADAA